PLNPKEAVPQLACVAFQLMVAGKQTATERELLTLLEDARDNVPQIRRYAKDAPHEFLQRVELRSSLLLEAGHQVEHKQTVPFYQFRHLTFQEYLAAVAVAEGHYIGYSKTDSALTPLKNHLLTEEWKEVVPMAAVLARKQAEPIIQALIEEARRLDINWEKSPREGPLLPKPVSRLVQCLVEEAEAAPETLTQALEIVAYYANGCHSQDDWAALSRGPYGAELWHQAWLLFRNDLKRPPGILASCNAIALGNWSRDHALSSSWEEETMAVIKEQEEEQVAYGLSIIGGHAQSAAIGRFPKKVLWPYPALFKAVENLIDHKSSYIQEAALWAWLLTLYYFDVKHAPSATTLSKILNLWLNGERRHLRDAAETALWAVRGQKRSLWTPVLDRNQVEQIARFAETRGKDTIQAQAVALFVAFHSRTVFSDKDLVHRLKHQQKDSRVVYGTDGGDPNGFMLKALSAAGQN
ncbi:MAG TPA: histidine kinase, partial [Prosthecobacter sp.]|nr:histidine kinase [Prosthecobacter sp.]